MTNISDLKEFLAKEAYDTGDLQRIIGILRAPGGCPWDAEQTHESIKKNFIEETYEVIEGINKCDDALLCEELGDVLLQIALHVEIARERGAFGWGQVTDGICRKLIVRHPHVFGETEVTGVDQVLQNWDAIKRRSKGQAAVSDAIASVPLELPALMRAQKIQHKAAKAGFDWRDNSALARLEFDLMEEVGELREALQDGDAAHAQAELGDVIFSAVNVARAMPGCDAEEALTAATERFRRRFAIVEQLAAQQNLDMHSAEEEALNALWEEAKNRLKDATTLST